MTMPGLMISKAMDTRELAGEELMQQMRDAQAGIASEWAKEATERQKELRQSWESEVQKHEKQESKTKE